MTRQCDSKNLHMSPLCDLQSNQGPSLWQGEVVDTYRSADGNNENLPDYIKVNPCFNHTLATTLVLYSLPGLLDPF